MALPFQETLKLSVANSSLRSGWRAFILCLSFANLCFLSTWAEMEDHEGDFFKVSTATWTHLAAATLDVLILSAILWVPMVLAVWSGKRNLVRILKWCILAGLMVPINSLRKDPYVIARSGELLRTRNGRLALAALGIALAVLLLICWERLSPRVTSAILIVLCPALPLTILACARSIHTGPSGMLANKPLLPALPQKPGTPHVLWILFDEWDQRLTFDARTANLQLPELDRFRGQAFYAGRAYPPARHTIVSVPSLLSGKTFVATMGNGASDMLLTYDRGQPRERLTAESTVFSDARTGGFNVGIVGWYLPYCRLFGSCTACSLPSSRRIERDDTELSLPELMLVMAQRLFFSLPLVARLGISPYEGVILKVIDYQQMVRDAIKSALDPRLNLSFIHLNVPHGPVAYDAAKGSFSTSQSHTYLDNLALVDRTVRDLRQALEQAGVWDSTIILLSSDHPLRVGQWRQRFGRLDNVQQSNCVPFLLKMAGEKRGLDYPRAIQTVVTKDLLLEVLNRRVTTAEQVAAWLDTHPPRQ